MLFRKHNPIESNILKAIHYNKTPAEYANEEKRFLDYFQSSIKTDFNLTDSDFTNFQNKLHIYLKLCKKKYLKININCPRFWVDT